MTRCLFGVHKFRALASQVVHGRRYVECIKCGATGWVPVKVRR